MDILINFYKDKRCSNPLINEYLSNQAYMGNPGLGDTVVITQLLKKANDVGREFYIYSHSHCFKDLVKNNPLYQLPPTNDFTRVEFLANFNFGNGHLIQKMQRAFRFKPDLKPKGFIGVESISKKKIGLHLTTGVSALDLRHIHPYPRQIYPENLSVIQELINSFKDYEFVEFGSIDCGLKNVRKLNSVSIEDSIKELSECEYFIGLNSGFMNLAAALNIKSIIIVNIPDANLLYLPMLVDAPIPDLTWLYPQNVHLHQDGCNELVPRLSLDSLKEAINGKVYPYWDDKYLNLINEI